MPSSAPHLHSGRGLAEVRDTGQGTAREPRYSRSQRDRLLRLGSRDAGGDVFADPPLPARWGYSATEGRPEGTLGALASKGRRARKAPTLEEIHGQAGRAGL